MASRTSLVVLIVGGIANLLVLAATLVLLVFWVGRPVAALGLSFSAPHASATLAGVVIIVASAVSFVAWLGRTGRAHVAPNRPVTDIPGTISLIAGVVVLFIVALQEEVLYRGYVTLNLLNLGPLVIVLASTILFTAIHLLTNRANFCQILSWAVSGAVFAFVYLISKSIWVPVGLHFAIDLTNMLVFDIAGRLSMFTITPALTDRRRAAYRVASAVVLVVTLLAFYAPIKLV